jgi:hypothetical protein
MKALLVLADQAIVRAIRLSSIQVNRRTIRRLTVVFRVMAVLTVVKNYCLRSTPHRVRVVSKDHLSGLTQVDCPYRFV